MKELPFDPALIDDRWIFDLPVPSSDFDPNVAERIKDAVESLPQIERDVIECLVWGQMTKVEVAETLGVSRQTVHDVYRRAALKLAKALRDLMKEEEE